MPSSDVGLQEAASLRERGHFQEAFELLSTLDTRRPDVAYHLAWVLDRLDRDGDAIAWYRRALKANPSAGEGRLDTEDHLGALLGLATVLIRAGQPDHAVDVLRAASGRFPSSAQVEALLLLVQGRLAAGKRATRGDE